MSDATNPAPAVRAGLAVILTPLMAHLLRRVREREISTSQLGLLSRWLDANPEVPEGRWFKRFPEMVVCGEGELVKTFLTPDQAPAGTEIE